MAYHKLTRNILFALIGGILVGALAPMSAGYFSWLGLVFKLSLAMIVMPLIFTSIMDGMHSIGDVRHLGKMGSRTVAFYLSTTFIAVFIGLVIVTTIEPGVRTPPENMTRAILSAKITNTDAAPQKIAEAMKTLGYVNTFGRGIARAQRFLGENGNPPAEFHIDEPAFFLATIREVAP